MNILIFLIPITLLLSGLGLLAFMWSLKTNQYDDIEGAASRILFDENSGKNHEDKAGDYDDY